MVRAARVERQGTGGGPSLTPVPLNSLFCIPTTELPSTPANTFYERLGRALARFGFGDAARGLCEPYCDQSRVNVSGIEPEVPALRAARGDAGPLDPDGDSPTGGPGGVRAGSSLWC